MLTTSIGPLILLTLPLLALTAFALTVGLHSPAGDHRSGSTPSPQFTVAQAHSVMQLHRECSTATCDRKADAYWTLVDAGRIKPVALRVSARS